MTKRDILSAAKGSLSTFNMLLGSSRLYPGLILEENGR